MNHLHHKSVHLSLSHEIFAWVELFFRCTIMSFPIGWTPMKKKLITTIDHNFGRMIIKGIYKFLKNTPCFLKFLFLITQKTFFIKANFFESFKRNTLFPSYKLINENGKIFSFYQNRIKFSKNEFLLFIFIHTFPHTNKGPIYLIDPL